MRNKIIKRVCITLLSLVLLVYVSIWVNSKIFKSKQSFLPYSLYIMSYDTENSEINLGDMIIAKNPNPHEINEKDELICAINGNMFIETVTKIEEKNGVTNIWIDGYESCSNEDLKNVKIIGKVVNNIKGWGSLALFTQSPFGTLNFLIIILCLGIILNKISKNLKENQESMVNNCIKIISRVIRKNRQKENCIK